MSPPIREGSGDSIGSIRLGDGSEISEVRTGAGDVLFSASTIPDSITNRWAATEGSGSTLSASKGAVNMSLNFSTWVTGTQFNGDTAPDADGSDDIATTTSNINVNGSQATVCFWTDGLDSGGSFSGLRNTRPDKNLPTNGHVTFLEQNETTLGLRYFNNGSKNDVFRGLTIPDASSTQLFFAVVINGDNGTVYVYDINGQQATGSGTATRGQTGDVPLSMMAGVGDHTEGAFDDVVASTTSALSQSEVEQVLNNTGPNA